MHRILGLFSQVVKENNDNTLVAAYIDPLNNTAIGGYRRVCGTGDLLMRARWEQPIDTQNIGMTDFVWDYVNQLACLEDKGLPGKHLPDGRYEVVDTPVADSKFGAVYAQIMTAPVGERFSVLLNPKLICDFIRNRTEHSGFADTKVNIEVFDGGLGTNGMMAAKCQTIAGEVGFSILVNTSPEGFEPHFEYRHAFVHGDSSLIPVNRLRDDQAYVVSLFSRVPSPHGDIIYVSVLREWTRGIRFVIQRFRDGLLMPDDPYRYTIFENAECKVTASDILDVPFIQGAVPQGNFEDELDFSGAPILHFDLDTLYRALNAMEGYKMVEMMFKDSITGIIVRTLPEASGPMAGISVDAIMGPTSPFKNGMVYTK